MRTHRIIFWTTLIIFCIGLIITLNISINSDIKNIFIGIICSSLVSAIVELPSLINYKSNIKSNIFFSLIEAKSFLLQFNDNINKRLRENNFLYENYGSYYINNICNNINIFNHSDNTIYPFFSSKKDIYIDSKKELNLLYNQIVQNFYEIDICRIQIKLKEKNIDDLHNRLKELEVSNNNLINKLDYIANFIFSNKLKKAYNNNSKTILNLLKK